MGSNFQMQPYYRTQASLTVDTNHTQNTQKFFEDEEAGILDDGVLDQGALDSGLEMSPNMVDSRRDSFAVGPSLFSPKTEDWHSAVEMQSVPSNNPFFEPHSSTPFPQPQSAGFQGPWPMSTSGSATPLQAFDGLPQAADFDSSVSIFQRASALSGQTPFSNPANQVSMFQHLGQPAGQSIPGSPEKDQWTQEMKNQVMVKRTRPGSPVFRGHNELRRGDGIRKKNARFDIPAERNLNNIDQLISQSTDEQEIKELKQQKRLLRNRQAAYVILPSPHSSSHHTLPSYLPFSLSLSLSHHPR